MTPDAPTPDPSPATIVRAALPEVYDERGHALPYDGGTDRILARLNAAGYEIVRRSDEFRDPTAIAEQRTKGWPDFHPEDFCHRCGHLNGNWFTDLGELEWLTVTGGVGIVCPSCFMALHRAQHGARIWELRSWTPEAPDA